MFSPFILLGVLFQEILHRKHPEATIYKSNTGRSYHANQTDAITDPDVIGHYNNRPSRDQPTKEQHSNELSRHPYILNSSSGNQLDALLILNIYLSLSREIRFNRMFLCFNMKSIEINLILKIIHMCYLCGCW